MISAILISILNVFFSPFGVLFFFLFNLGESKYFEQTETNTSRLKLIPFLVHHIIFTLFILGVTYLWSIYSYDRFSVWDVFIPKYYWVSGLGWLVTIFFIKTYLEGMEGNIMGFIFFPMLLMPIILLFAVNIGGFLSIDNQARLMLIGSEIDLNIWVRVLLHTFLPIYILLFLNKNNTEIGEDVHWGGFLISSLILQMMFFVFHWLIFLVTNQEFTFSQYFGENQNMVYYLPMVVGVVYFIFSMASKQKTITSGTIKYSKFMILSVMVFLELVNYLLMIKSVLGYL